MTSSIHMNNYLMDVLSQILQMHRDYESLDSDTPRVFRRKSTVAPRKNILNAAKAPSSLGDNRPAGMAPIRTSITGGTSPPISSTIQAAAASSNAGDSKKQHGGHNKKRSPTATSRRGSGSGGVSHHHLNRKEQIYSHLMQVRSVSMVRSSTMSSRNSASISEFSSFVERSSRMSEDDQI